MYVCTYVRTYDQKRCRIIATVFKDSNPCLYVCMYVRMYVRMIRRDAGLLPLLSRILILVCMYVCMYVRMYVRMIRRDAGLLPLLSRILILVCMYVRMYVCMMEGEPPSARRPGQGVGFGMNRDNCFAYARQDNEVPLDCGK
jgi:hypothetical protein